MITRFKSIFNFFLNTRNISSIRYIFLYIYSLFKFIKLGGRVDTLLPIFVDFFDGAGTARGHYFHQDLYVADLIYKNNPESHFDIGSRIDGFVAHVASFRVINVIDVRPLPETGHANINFRKLDLNSNFDRSELTDSISCLHVIEHFGLGRYGDKIDPHGHLNGVANILDLLKNNGKFYISFPISNKNKIFFNAHRVFHPCDILGWSVVVSRLKLISFSYVNDEGDFIRDHDLASSVPELKYGCGIYVFEKVK